MNNLTMSGNLTQDPELIHHKDRPICRMRLAVDNGRYPTTYIDLRTFDAQAYVCAEYLRKGRKVGVVGRLAYEEWVGADDKKRRSYSVIGRVEFLDRPPEDLVEQVGDGDGPGSSEAGSEEPQLLAA
jgi:single-strand DNA-binding protein